MDWTSLGHACWLIEAAGLRLLTDPLLHATHYNGVFEVTPRRTVEAEALAADFILVSHAHPDHFHVPSLRRLAELDPESVVVTPDPLVAWTATELGFQTVHQVPPGQQIALDGVTLVTTPSIAADEWGLMVATSDGVVWNQVDTVLEDAAAACRVAETALAALDAKRITLALVRWQPMLEVAANLCWKTGFPLEEYRDVLEQVAAIPADALVPSAAGDAHAAGCAWMNHYVYPVPESRFRRDMATLLPGVPVHSARPGTRFQIRAGAASVGPQGGRDLVTLAPEGDADRSYRPFHLPALEDTNAAGRDVAAMRWDVERWLRDHLTGALAEAYGQMQTDRPLRFVAEVVFPERTDAYTFTVDAAGARLEQRHDEDWDVLNAVAGSLLWEVLEGRRHWGELLLGGALRACTRAYALQGQQLRQANVAEIFLYYGLSYEQAVRRAVEWEVGVTSPPAWRS